MDKEFGRSPRSETSRRGKGRASRNPTEPNSTVTKPPWMTGRPAAYGRREVGVVPTWIYIGTSLRSLSFPPSWKAGEEQDDASRLVEPSCVNRIFLRRTNIHRNVGKNFNCRLYNFYNIIAPRETNFLNPISRPKMLENGRPNGFVTKGTFNRCRTGAHTPIYDRKWRTIVIVCTHREIGISRIRSVCKQPLSLLLGRCQTGKRSKNGGKKEEEERERRVPQGTFLLLFPPPCLRSYFWWRSFAGYLISTWRIIAFRRVLV